MKKKLYLILPMLMIISLLSSAAICNLGPAKDNGGTQDQTVEDNNQSQETKKESSGASNSSNSQSEQPTVSAASDDNNKKDKKSGDTNNPPVIAGIYLDDMNPVDYFFFADETYTVRAEAIDPEGDSLTFNWSGDGAIAGKDANPMS